MKTFISLNESDIITKLYFVIDNDDYKTRLGSAIEVDYNKLIKYVTKSRSTFTTQSPPDAPILDESIIIGAYFNIEEYNNI